MGFLRKVFGPSRDEMWQQLAREMDARFVEGGFWKGSSRVEVSHGEWTVTLDSYTVSTGKSSTTYTRIRAPYVNRDGFRFKVYRKSFFSGLGKLFGMQDVAVGYPEFDEDFIIQGTDEGRLRQLFGNPRIRQLIQAQPHIHFQVRDDEGWFGTKFPEGVDELQFEVVGTIKDVQRLKLLFDLFAETLNYLCHMGSAYESDPQVTLK